MPDYGAAEELLRKNELATKGPGRMGDAIMEIEE
jgi:hypothetical protein